MLSLYSKTKKIKTVSVTKNIPLHIENYSEFWYSSNDYFQYNIYHQNFSKTIVNQVVLNKSLSQIGASWEDVHDEWFILNKYNHLSNLTFYEFFLEHKIDIPSCFKKSHSLLRPQRELTILSFITYFMRHGLKLKTQITFIKSLQEFFNQTFLPTLVNIPLSWKFIFTTIQNTFYLHDNTYASTLSYTNQAVKYGHYLDNSSKNISSQPNMFNLLYKNLLNLLPLFSFYIYKVDKKIFKNTRGKSGKFTFIWKFITPYKRLAWVMYWLSKEIKLKAGRTLNKRFETLFNDILFNPQSTWVFKVKRFSYNYVYRNCRSTLAETYRTTTK